MGSDTGSRRSHGDDTRSDARDPALFLTTLSQWDRTEFTRVMARGPGALAALEVVPPPPVGAPGGGAYGRERMDAIGVWVTGYWPALVAALGAWPESAAQRGGWGLVWGYAPGADPAAVGEAIAAAPRPLAAARLEGRLVVVPVHAAGTSAVEAAIRVAEDELHRWHHGERPAGHPLPIYSSCSTRGARADEG